MQTKLETKKEIERFKRDIQDRTVSDAVRRNLTFGECILLKQDDLFDLRSAVAENFGIHPTEVVLVGSAKLGFSIAPEKRYRSFGEESDLDIAIVSPVLFEQLWKDLQTHVSSVDCMWHEADSKRFRKYFFRGWIRPDLMPFSKSFKLRTEWFEFFTRLTNSERFGPYKISAGLYRDWFFFEQYQSICIQQCKQELELSGIDNRSEKQNENNSNQ